MASSAVLDFDKLKEDAKLVRDRNKNESTFETRTGESIAEYQRDLAVNARIKNSIGMEGLGSFRAEIGVNFNKVDITNSSYAFATASSLHIKDAYYIDGYTRPAELKKYLSKEFSDDIASMDAQGIIDKYGTHVMLGSIMGARVDFHLAVETKSSSSATYLDAYVRTAGEVNIKGIELGAERDIGTSDTLRQ